MDENRRRKQVLHELKQKQKEEFEHSLPIARELFVKLFHYLDDKLEENGCDDTN